MSSGKWIFWFGLLGLGVDAVVIGMMHHDAYHPPLPVAVDYAAPLVTPAPVPFAPACPPTEGNWSDFDARHLRLSDSQCLCALVKDGATISYGYKCEQEP